jgi:CrcB protein
MGVIVKELLWVFVGGGLGSICRYAITIILKETDWIYPWPTLLANAIGSFLIGVLADQCIRNTSAHSANILFWIIGFCGGLTTFSAFAMENLTLFRTSGGVSLIIYASLTYFVCLGMVLFGTSLSKLIF